MTDAAHILVVEDEATQRSVLVEYLTRQGFDATGLSDGAALRRTLLRSEPDLVLLDLGLPGEDGHSLARHLRQDHPRVAVIMVTAAGSTVDRIIGLETGADDYIPKPFEPRELLARIKSVLRRALPASAQIGPTRVPMGRRVLDLEQRVLLDPDGTEERLTASEFELLRLFAENPNKPLNREWLLEATSHREAEAYDRAIDLRIARLRRKIEANPAHPDAIRTVRGIGYMFVPA
ncbi:MAG: response regulator [Rhodospirillales bacterium]|jgi:DNA-binding response OmpR family regulator